MSYMMPIGIFLQAADQGDAAAKRDLGLVYSRAWRGKPPDPEKALQWFEAASVSGDARAASYIGDFYLDPSNHEVNPSTALFWYTQSYQRKDARGTIALAQMYCNATGVKRDYRTCADDLSRALSFQAKTDPPEVHTRLSEALYSVARHYQTGDGVARSPLRAAALYQQAATLGNLPAAIAASRLYSGHKGMPQDLPRALAILDDISRTTRINAGSPQQKQLAAAYAAVGASYEARGASGLSQAAAVYTHVAVDLDDIVPLLNLIERYIHGTRVPRSADRAYALMVPLMQKDVAGPDDALLYKTCADLAALYLRATPPNTQRAEALKSFRNYLHVLPSPVPPHPVVVGDAGPPPPPTERYPNIAAPDSVTPQQEFAVNVSLNALQFDQNTQILSGQQQNGQLQITLPQGMTQMPIQVDLIAPGMTFINGDTNSSSLILDAGQPNSTPAIFHLRAGSAPASGVIMATLSYHQNFIAQLERPITIVAATSDATTPPTSNSPAPAPAQPGSDAANTRADIGPLRQAPAIKPRNLAINPPSVGLTAPRLPDLQQSPPRPKPTPVVIDPTAKSTDLTITETLVGDTLYYTFESPGLVGAVSASVPNAAATRAKVQQDFNQLQSESLVLSSGGASSDVALCTAAHARPGGDNDPSCADSLQARALLQGIGSDLYSHDAPAEFRTLYQLLVSEHIRLHTITVNTNSPTLPWELMLPNPGTDNYLGLTAAIVRVNSSAPQAAGPPQIGFSGIAVVAPNYSGDKQLPAVQSEIDHIKSDFPTAQLVEGDASDVSTLVRNQPQSIIHYSGHGQLIPPPAGSPAALAPQTAIVLEDASMTPDTFVAFRDQGKDAHPFYFFNACDLGRSDGQIDYITGWAPALMQSGASGYLGALFTIGDSSAASFAAHFYANLKSNLATTNPLPLADIVTQARRQTYAEAYDPTALAYVLYAKPFMTLVADNQ